MNKITYAIILYGAIYLILFTNWKRATFWKVALFNIMNS